jgi:endonuclease YncB( thermonuclease family)
LRSSRIRLAGVWLALLLATGAAADTRTCRVAAIADADSLTCLLGGARTEVRLDEIDAPEREQRYGSESRRSLTSLAWVYDHYVKDRSLYNDQTLARSQSRGLWADADPTA